MNSRGIADAAELLEVMSQGAIDRNGALEAGESLGQELVCLAQLGGVAAGAECIAHGVAGRRNVVARGREESLRGSRYYRENGRGIHVGECGYPLYRHGIGMGGDERGHFALEWPQGCDELARE